MLSGTKKLWPYFYSVAAAFIISAGWSWYHWPHRPHGPFIWRTVILLAVALAAYQIFRAGYRLYVRHSRRLPFWQDDFVRVLDQLFFIFSLSFLSFFSRWEIVSVLWFLAVGVLFYWRLQSFFSAHPLALAWRTVHRAVFIWAGFLFCLNVLLQYIAYRYYILDAFVGYYNVVLFRAFAMTAFWLAGLAVAAIIFSAVRRGWRYAALAVWLALFLFALFCWAVNIGVLFFSGLYLSPTAVSHADGAGGVIWNSLTAALIIGFALAAAAVVFLVKFSARAFVLAPKKYWRFYATALIGLFIVSFLGLSSFSGTPEFTIVRSFYRYFFSQPENISLPLNLQKKLERFGLVYDTNQFYVAHKNVVFSDPAKLLPAKFSTRPPNVVVIFWESLSARLTDVYNPDLKDLTPGLDEMKNDPDTTVFKKFFNASTPTVTGLMSMLCSVLPPTGHEEIEKENLFRRHYLGCLPKILRSYGYDYAAYITAVEKDYANKDTIFESMGVKDVYGTDELAALIPGKPLAWGYSDHQMMPVLMQKMVEHQAEDPFLLMLSTVDTHPPFNLAKDEVPYGDGKVPPLNAFHTTDDAFKKFWENFKQSPFADNTIVIVVADHAVFPAAYHDQVLPADPGWLSYYDENAFLMYVPDSVLPKEVDRYASGLDFTPTLLQILGINAPNAFEGHSIFDDRALYPNLLGMHELGLYINEEVNGKRQLDYEIPSRLDCAELKNEDIDLSAPLTLCEFWQYYQWKRVMFEQGRFWEK